MPRTALSVLALACLVVLAACGKDPTPTPSLDLHPEMGKPFEMRIGDAAFIDAQGYRVTFKSIESDSRCPPNGQCLHPDVAIIVLEIRPTASSDAVEHKVFFDSGTSVESIEGYDVQILKLEPQVDKVKSPSDYVMTLVITKPTGTPTINPHVSYDRNYAKVGDVVTFTASSDGAGLAQYTLEASDVVVAILRYDGTLVRGPQTPVIELVDWSADADQATWKIKMLGAGVFSMKATVTGEVPIGDGAYCFTFGNASTFLTVE